MDQARKFSVFPKISEGMEYLRTEDEKAKFAYAVMMYGAYGIEPELEFPADMLFAVIKEDIDNSIKQSEAGSKGGSGSKPKGASEKSESTPRKGASKTRESTLRKGASEKSESTLCEKSEAKPYQSNPNQTIPIQSEDAHAPEPPGLDEVRDYFAANCLKGDPDLFFANYTESGWKKNGVPIEDWHGSALKWHIREPEFEQSRRSREEADRLRVERFKPPEERAPTGKMPMTYDERMRAEAQAMGVA